MNKCKIAGLLSAAVVMALVATPARADQDLDRVFGSFTRNTIPNPKLPGHAEAFQFYVRTHFAGRIPESFSRGHAFDRINDFLDQKPRAGKALLGSADLVRHVNPAADEFARELRAGYLTLNQTLRRSRANLGEWRKIKWDGGRVFGDEDLARLPADEDLTSAPATAPDVAAGAFVRAYARFFVRVGLPKNIADALVINVAHFAALHFSPLSASGNFEDGAISLADLNDLLALRQRLITNEGVSESAAYLPMMRAGVGAPDVVRRRLELARAADRIRTDRLRPLSLAESPLRSWLAEDCATDSYFDKGFDPAFYYFTVTDEANVSTGHFTVVLGRAWAGVRGKPVAFVDKIQGVRPDRLPSLIEALRRITSASGFELALPNDPGDSNGLSNDDQIRAAIQNLAAYAGQTIRYRGFRADGRGKVGPSGFSRAYNFATLRPVLAHEGSAARTTITIRPPEPQVTLAGSVNVKQYFEGARKLRDGSPADRIKYLDRIALADDFDESSDDEVRTQIDGWARDRSLPTALRFRAVTFLIRRKFDGEILNAFTKKELRELLRGWSQSTSFKRAMRIQIWMLAPYLRGDTQLPRAGAFPPALSESARRLLADTLISPAFADELKLLSIESGNAMHISFTTALVYLETYLRARDGQSALTSELRTAAAAELIQTFAHMTNVLPPHDDYAVPHFARVFGREALHLSTAELRAFVAEERDSSREPGRSVRLAHLANRYAHYVGLAAAFGGFGLIWVMDHAYVGGALQATGVLMLGSQVLARGKLDNATAQVFEQRVHARRLDQATEAATALAAEIDRAACEIDLVERLPYQN